MPRFAANLSFQYQEYSFPDRFRAAAKDGFTGVEYLFPYEHEAAFIAGLLKENNLTQVLFNAPPGDWSAGERGIASLPGREEEFKRGIDTALRYADVLGNKLVHVMAGVIARDQERASHRDVYLRNLAYATEAAAAHSITILIEPINPRDMPGYFLTRHPHPSTGSP
jgi:hydroxypyruvate isomerase